MPAKSEKRTEALAKLPDPLRQTEVVPWLPSATHPHPTAQARLVPGERSEASLRRFVVALGLR